MRWRPSAGRSWIMGRPRIDIRPGACLLGAVLLLVLPLRWLLAWVAAALIHEGAHILAVYACGGKVRGIEVGAIGAKIAVAPMSPGREAICALAGPIGGFAALLFVRWLPAVALFAFLQSACNLIPLYPLDGGRALRCLLELALGPERAENISAACNRLLLFVLLAAGFYAVIRWQRDILFLLVPLALLLKCLPRKIPCKRGPLGLQ